MKVIPLETGNKINNCNSYLILGNWNRIKDFNTIVDPGTDLSVLQEISELPTGLGKIKVKQIILTHNQLDNLNTVMAIKGKYNARVLSYSDGPGVDELLKDGQIIKAGDEILEVLHTPGHSSDSICLYAPSEKILFSGDTLLRIRMPGESLTEEFLGGLLKIACRDVQRIYSSYDEPMLGDCNELILQSLRNANQN